MVKRRRKIKRKVKIFIMVLLIIILSILVIIYLTNNKTSPKKVKINKEKELISNILEKNIDSKIDEEFLKWISTNYKEESLSKLNDYLNNNEYNPNIWHKITGNSYIVLKDLYNKKYDNMNNITINNDKAKDITINFIGDVSLADNWYLDP